MTCWVGEVWIYAGGVHASRTTALQPDATAIVEQIKTAPETSLRLFSATMKTASQPQTTIQGRWMTADAGSANSLNSSEYFLGRKLVAELGVPVGMVIAANWGRPSRSKPG